METSLKFKIVFFPFFSLALLMTKVSAAQVNPNPCALCIQHQGGQNLDLCLKSLEAKDLSFLSGRLEPISVWEADEDVLPKLCERIRSGDGEALSIGFRLAVVLDEASNGDLIEALGESMLKNPTGFLEKLQDMMDFGKKENVVGPLKECYWSAFIDSDFGYGRQPGGEPRAIRKRREAIQKVHKPVLKEVQTYILELLDEKLRRLTTEM